LAVVVILISDSLAKKRFIKKKAASSRRPKSCEWLMLILFHFSVALIVGGQRRWAEYFEWQ